jgi:hypothetical protein
MAKATCEGEGPHAEGECRRVPLLGTATITLCAACFHREMRAREAWLADAEHIRTRYAKLGKPVPKKYVRPTVPVVAWASLDVVGKANGKGSKDVFEHVTDVGVDAGCIWIGDPCYVMGDEASHRVKSWDGFATKLFAEMDETKAPFAEPLGHWLGVCAMTGGDGRFPVYVRRTADGGIAEIRIVINSSL